MIITVDKNGITEYSWLLEALLGCAPEDLEKTIAGKPPVISLVGGGGKTTCVKAMASECMQKKIGAVVATTTHMQMPHDEFLLDTEDMDAFHELMNSTGQVWLGKRLDPALQLPNMVKNKSRSLSLDFIRRVCREKAFPVLIEADGARCLPLKAPAEHEPVIVPETTITAAVCGLDVLGRSFEDSVFRPELACELLGRDLSDAVAPEDIAGLALSPGAGRKAVAPGMDYQVVLNKADDDGLVQTALSIAEELIGGGVSRVHITCGLRELMR